MPKNNHHKPLLERHKKNPILTARDWPYAMNTVFNAGATRLADGSTLLLCRVEDRRGHSHLCVARSENGIDAWQIDLQPTLLPDPRNYPEEIWGIEDPRITFLPDLEKYAITYTSFSRGGPGVSLALTEDFVTFQRVGDIMPPWDKDAALLPRRFNGLWQLIHRPTTTGHGAHIW
ncbi:MAG: glycosidase, partial [Fidelibacterota bacterium]